MTDDHSPSPESLPSWRERLLKYFRREPKDQQQLVEVLHDAEQRNQQVDVASTLEPTGVIAG